MKRGDLSAFLALCVVLLAARAALAERVYVAPETYLDEAQAIVIGKMTNVDAEEGTGEIAVTDMVRGDKELRHVAARFGKRPKPQGGVALIMEDGPVTYEEGQEGIWLLRPRDRDEHGTYDLGEYHLFYDLDQLDHLKETMAALEKLPWGEPVGGLAARTLVHAPPWPNQRLIYVAVKNVSEKPLRISDYIGHRALAVTLVLPDGTEQPIELYEFLQRVKLKAPEQKDYPVLAPGDVRYVGFWAGISTGNLTLKGVYRVKASYSNADKGGAVLGYDVAWTGTVNAPEVTFEYVPAEAPGTPVP